MSRRPERNNEPGEPIAGTPRTLRELGFAGGSRPCAHCGAYADLLRWKYLDSEPIWRTHATCPACGNERVYLFAYTDDLTDVDPPELQLGDGPTTVLDPRDLLGVVDRLAPTITTPLVTLDDDSEPNWDRVERIQTALNELAKLVPDGATEVPATAFRDAAGRAHHAAHRARYGQPWIGDAIARYAALVEHVVPSPPAPVVERRGTIDRASLLAHREWSRTGAATRLEVVGVSARALKLDGSQIQGGRFTRVDFAGADLNLCDWSEAELHACSFVDARINRGGLARSQIVDCVFDGIGAALLNLTHSAISGSSFARAGMPGSDWRDAVVRSTRFVEASFGNARWDRARFIDCDFRGAALEPDRELPPTCMRGAVFEGCNFGNANLQGTDLRGVTFARCTLAGARGEPKYFDELVLDGCDVSLAALKRLLVLPTITAAELLPGQVVAHDRADDADPALVVFDVGPAGARRIAQITAPATASTCGPNRVVWMATPQGFSVWAHDSRRLVVSHDQATIWTPGSELAISAVARIASFIDPRQLGRRGVALITAAGRLVFVQDQDILASLDPTYTLAQARHEGAWAAALGADLAYWLGVPHDELRTDLEPAA
jgi:uncharacterized protein YjbI with pentapeptide repeats